MKNKGMMIGCAIGAVVLLAVGMLVAWGVSSYNNMVSLDQEVITTMVAGRKSISEKSRSNSKSC